jgi:transcriptional regulator
MYLPPHFQVTDEKEIFTFIEANAFGQLISTVDGRHFATHVPFLVSPDKSCLLTHLARLNPQHLKISGQEVLIILAGPHDYISPSWYTGAGVPTWNYQTVHLYGQCRRIDDPPALRGIVDGLAAKYEAGFDHPWQPRYSTRMLDAIVGLEISITDVQCKYKLSQNRSSQDQDNVIRQLRDAGSDALADAMAAQPRP